MGRIIGPLAGAFAVAALPGIAIAKSPDLSSCPPPEQPDGGEVQRTRAIPVPQPLRKVMGSGRYHFAVATLDGGTFCIDNSWTETIEEPALSPDGRFLSWRWYGYETYGYQLVDRTGKGALHEIGARPVFSPDHRQFAAIDQTESEFGTLSGLAVWRVDPSVVSRTGQIEDIPRMNDWRIDGWIGERCIALSALAQQRTPENPAEWAKAQRDRFVAWQGRGEWRLAPGAAGCPAR